MFFNSGRVSEGYACDLLHQTTIPCRETTGTLGSIATGARHVDQARAPRMAIMNLKRKFILPRRLRPEMHEVERRLQIRHYVRFMRRYTDLPVGLEVRIDPQLVADVVLATELFHVGPHGRIWCIAAEGRQIYEDCPLIEYVPDIYESVARRVASSGTVQILSDNLVTAIFRNYDYQKLVKLMVAGSFFDNPQSGSEFYSRGNGLCVQEDYIGALAAYDRVIEIYPNDFRTRQSRAEVLEKLGRFAEAAGDRLAAYKATAARDDVYEYFEALVDLAAIWEKLESPTDFLPLLEELVRAAAHITFETEWDDVGDGVFHGNEHFGGYAIAGKLSFMLEITASEKLASADEKLTNRLTAARKRLLELRRMYGPVKDPIFRT